MSTYVMGTFSDYVSYFTALTLHSRPISYPMALALVIQILRHLFEMEKILLLIVLSPLEALATVPPPTTSHRLPKGSKMVFRGGRRQKTVLIYENIFFRSHLSHYNRIQLDKVWVPFELKRNKGKFQFFPFLAPDFGIKCQFCNLSFYTSIFVQLDSLNMTTLASENKVTYS